MYDNQRLLIANRGEIAVRILRTAKSLGLRTIAIYSPSDVLSPHVDLANEAIPLHRTLDAIEGGITESQAYLSVSKIISICKEQSVTLVHPGYGFLSENAEFAELVTRAGITWLGPRPEIIRSMGIKHEARKLARRAGVNVIPGSDALIEDVEDALLAARQIGFPLIIKATAGGGGMGMVICQNERELIDKFPGTKARAQSLFSDPGVFLERYILSARHIEVQIFGDGSGNVIHLGERECSVQRKHQKIIEETPSPFCEITPGLRELICDAAIRLGHLLRYNSAGTVEFLVDDTTSKFYFLEMNTRIQVEHTITEACHPGLDIVEMMVQQGLAERHSAVSSVIPNYKFLESDAESSRLHAIEARIYAENPSDGFKPCPGLLQNVDLPTPDTTSWLRIDSWIATGTTVSPFFDPLLCKIVVTGSTRDEAIARLRETLEKCNIHGPPNNIEHLQAIHNSEIFRQGIATTTFLQDFEFIPRAVTVLSPGLEATIQDLPGRTMGLGIPRSGPMDPMAFRAANILVNNMPQTEGLEIIVIPGVNLVLHFHTSTVIAVAGREVSIRVNDQDACMWAKIVIPAGGRCEIGAKETTTTGLGFRAYLAIRGGFPGVPHYLSSKSTSMGLGGYQGRSLIAGDQLSLGDCGLRPDEPDMFILPKQLIPEYPLHWVIHVLSGPHDDDEFVTSAGIVQFYSSQWRVSSSSNRMGIRLEGPEKITWARQNGRDGGSHPSNILDNGYAPGSININGDTPVILGNEGPDMGGYICLCAVAMADTWKLGQVGPGNMIKFNRISWEMAMELRMRNEEWLQALKRAVAQQPFGSPSLLMGEIDDPFSSQKLRLVEYEKGSGMPQAVFRQAGDSAILVEFGPMKLDFMVRALVHAFELRVLSQNIEGLRHLSPCIRSTMCHYDPGIISQYQLLEYLVNALQEVPNFGSMEFHGRKFTMPIVLDDRWNRDAIVRYMRTTRDKAVYLPSNVEYLANNNGLRGGAKEALRKLVSSDWLVFGVGFYLACPFLVPVDPRCRLVGQKMNPSRTYTPRGSIGIAGVVAAIYPVESPGGYQLYGRTLPAWQTWGRGKQFNTEQPWLLQPFDQVRFEEVTEAEYIELEKEFDAGRYVFKVEPATFSMTDYMEFTASIAAETSSFQRQQVMAVALEEVREQELLRNWESEKQATVVQSNEIEIKSHHGTKRITSSLFASVWKFRCRPGEVIQSEGEVLVTLEAMKTEVDVKASKADVGRRIIGFGQGVHEGAVVKPGDVLVVLE